MEIMLKVDIIMENYTDKLVDKEVRQLMRILGGWKTTNRDNMRKVNDEYI